MDPDTVAKSFVEHYYSTFDTNRATLANLYQDSSMLTFEGQKIQGSSNIVAKLTSTASPPLTVSPLVLPAACLFSFPVTSNSPANNMLLSSVRYIIHLMFHLMPTPQSSFYVLNDIFRLNYA
ncbi:putative nuclear transport factor 2, NTF2-like domain superfamily [Helianthus debilis subsp. tardiflorus]